jgi:hypothetical protein
VDLTDSYDVIELNLAERLPYPDRTIEAFE